MPLLTSFNTIAEMFAGVVAYFGTSTKPAFQRKVAGKYADITYPELHQHVEAFALALRSLGVSRGDHIGLMSENRLEWVVTDLACACSGIADVPIFPILTPAQVEYIFNDARVKAVVCSNQLQLNKLLKVVANIPTLHHIIVMQPELTARQPEAAGRKIISFQQMLEDGQRLATALPGQLNNLIAEIEPSDMLTLIYTSGTTGHPKGVVLSHGNLVANIQGAAAAFPAITESDVVLSYLPLCHSYERLGGYYTCMACGATIAFADSIDTVRTNLPEVRPTLMTSVPRLFERIKAGVEKQVAEGSEKNRKVFQWALGVGIEKFRLEQAGKKPGVVLAGKYALADKLVFAKIREKMGGRIRFFVSGGAALPHSVGEFFFAAGLPVIEGYGMTESSPVISANPYTRPRLGTVGKPLPNVEVMIASDGEILTRGPHVMQGYYNNPEATAEAIDPQGWLHTGDIGVIDAEGYLKITDRKKHLLVSSGGKNIAPGPIESTLLHSPLIDQIMLIGDDRPYLTALIVPDFDVLKEVLQSQGINVGNIHDMAVREQVLDYDAAVLAVEADIKRLQRDLSAFERVRRFDLLAEPFTVENHLLTPTLKVKRKEVEKIYAQRIEAMYQGMELD